MKRKVVVFAGNICRKARETYYFSLAYKMGKLLAESGFITVTGGGPGLMDQALKGAFENGGETIGIQLIYKNHKQSKYASQISSFRDLRPRQDKLFSLADAFIALPGGIGTFYEIFGVIGLKRKGEISRNIPLILISDYFKKFEELMNKMKNEGFTGNDASKLYVMVKDPKEALIILKSK